MVSTLNKNKNKRIITKDDRNSARPEIGIYQAGLPDREIGNPDRDLRRKRKEIARKWATNTAPE